MYRRDNPLVRSFELRDVQEFFSCSSNGDGGFDDANSEAGNSEASFMTARGGSDILSMSSVTSSPARRVAASIWTQIHNRPSNQPAAQQPPVADRDVAPGVEPAAPVVVKEDGPSPDKSGSASRQRHGDVGDPSELDGMQDAVVDALSGPKLDHEPPPLEEEEPAHKRVRPLSVQVKDEMLDAVSSIKTPTGKTPSSRTGRRATHSSSKHGGHSSGGSASNPTTPVAAASGSDPNSSRNIFDPSNATTSGVQLLGGTAAERLVRVTLGVIGTGADEHVSLTISPRGEDGMFVFAGMVPPIAPDSTAASPEQQQQPEERQQQGEEVAPRAAEVELSPVRTLAVSELLASPRNDPMTPKDQNKGAAKSASARKAGEKAVGPGNPLGKLLNHAKGLFRNQQQQDKASSSGNSSKDVGLVGADSDVINNHAASNMVTAEQLAADIAAAAVPVVSSQPLAVNVVHIDTSAALAGAFAPTMSPKQAPRDAQRSPRTPGKDQQQLQQELVQENSNDDDDDTATGVPAPVQAISPVQLSPASDDGDKAGGAGEVPLELTKLVQSALAAAAEGISAAPVAGAAGNGAAAGVVTASGVTPVGSVEAPLNGEGSLPLLEASDSPVMQAKPANIFEDQSTDAAATDNKDGGAAASIDAGAGKAAEEEVQQLAGGASPGTTAKRAFTTVAGVVRKIIPGFRVSTIATVGSPSQSVKTSSASLASGEEAAEAAPTCALAPVQQVVNTTTRAMEALRIEEESEEEAKALAAAEEEQENGAQQQLAAEVSVTDVIASASATPVKNKEGDGAAAVAAATTPGSQAKKATCEQLVVEALGGGVPAEGACTPTADSTSPMFVFTGSRSKAAAGSRPARLSVHTPPAAGHDAAAAVITPGSKRKPAESAKDVVQAASAPKAPRLVSTHEVEPAAAGGGCAAAAAAAAGVEQVQVTLPLPAAEPKVEAIAAASSAKPSSEVQPVQEDAVKPLQQRASAPPAARKPKGGLFACFGCF